MIQHSAMTRVHETIVSDPMQTGNLRIHPPSSSRGMVGSSVAPQEGGGGIKIFSYLRYRWVTVFFLGAALASILALTAWKLIPSKFTTYAMIRVSVEDPKVYLQENPMGRGDFVTYLKTQADMIRSWQVLNGAIRDPSIAELTMLREQIDPIKFLEEELRIEFKEGSEIVKLLLSGEDPKGITNIVNSILQAYDREVVQEELKKKKYRLQLLEDSILQMQKDVKQMYGNRQTVAEGDKKSIKEERTPINPQLATSELIRHKQTLSMLEADLKASQIRKESLETRLKTPEAEMKIDSFVMEQLEKEPRLAMLIHEIEFLQSRLEYDLNTLGASPTHPVVVEKQQRLSQAIASRDEMKKKKLEEIASRQNEGASKKTSDELEGIKTTLIILNARKEETQKLVDEYEQIVQHPMGISDRPPDFYFVDMKEREGTVKGMIDKANQLRVEVTAPPRVRLIPAATPVKKEMKKQILGTAIAALIGFALVGFLVVVFESRINRALSLHEVQQSTLGPILGVIPSAGRGGPNLRPVAAGAVAEAVDKLRTHLQQQFDNNNSKVIMVCSSLKDEGKSFLTGKLGESFARSGDRVLVVDFDLRTPALHRRMKLNNDKGICDVLRNEMEWRDAIQTTETGISLLAAGKWNNGVRVELIPERLLTLFSRLREHYDWIVVNTHALLPVAETYLAARYADGILLAIEKYESRLGFVTRTQDKIANLAPEAFGVVFLGASEEECLN